LVGNQNRSREPTAVERRVQITFERTTAVQRVDFLVETSSVRCEGP
jgi:hypothetical protein